MENPYLWLMIPLSIFALAFVFNGFPDININIGNKYENHYYKEEEGEGENE